MSSKKSEARDRVKAMREEQARQGRKREQLIRFGIAGAVLAAVVIIAVAVQLGRDDPGGAGGAIPAGATASGDGVAVGSDEAPVTIDVWIDFQCPWCKKFEDTKADVLDELVADGTARVVYHPVAFLGEESARATNAFGCAIDGGKPVEFLRELFDNQPPESSGGYTGDDLLAHGAAVGLSGEAFGSCVTDGTYADWGTGPVRDAMNAAGHRATPTVLVDGDVVADSVDMRADDFRALVEQASAAGN